jgi:hypothetical protein
VAACRLYVTDIARARTIRSHAPGARARISIRQWGFRANRAVSHDATFCKQQHAECKWVGDKRSKILASVPAHASPAGEARRSSAASALTFESIDPALFFGLIRPWYRIALWTVSPTPTINPHLLFACLSGGGAVQRHTTVPEHYGAFSSTASKILYDAPALLRHRSKKRLRNFVQRGCGVDQAEAVIDIPSLLNWTAIRQRTGRSSGLKDALDLRRS